MTPLAWKRLGRSFDPTGRDGWMASHAQNPTPLPLQDRIRIYCNVRPPPDANGRYTARVAYVDVQREDPTRVIAVSRAPVLELGGLGAFDEFGTMVQGIAERPERGEIWMYYVGWTRKLSVPFDWAIGLAISRDGGEHFEPYGRGPIIGPTPQEPFLLACPHVRQIEGVWHMWYGAGIEWRKSAVEPIYRIFHATSRDGLAWLRTGEPCLPTIVPDECQTSPTILYRDGNWIMLFSYRHGEDFRGPERGYRIGCAVSRDLTHWERSDIIAGLQPASSGWDTQMQCYPYILEDLGKTYLFYCGDDFGRAGFGVAELVTVSP